MVREKTRSRGDLHRSQTTGSSGTTIKPPDHCGHGRSSSCVGDGYFGNINNPSTSAVPSDADDGEELPPASPGTPPKKVWEQKYKNFLHRKQGGNSRERSSSGGSFSSSSANPGSSLDARIFIPPRNTAMMDATSSYAFAGSHPLVTAPAALRSNRKVAPPPPPPVHDAIKRDSLRSGSSHGHNDGRTGEDSSVRGGKLFSHMFRKNNSNHDISGGGGGGSFRGSHKSLPSSDELDVAMRRGVEKAYSPKITPRTITHSTQHTTDTVVPESSSSVPLPPQRLSIPSEMSSLDDSSVTPSMYRASPPSGHRLSPSSVQIHESLGWGQHHVLDKEYKKLQNVEAEEEEEEEEGGYVFPPSLQILPLTVTSLPSSPPVPFGRDRFPSITSVEEDDMAQGNDASENSGPNALDIFSRKKAFTEFHNANDSDSPFLGDDFSISRAALFFQAPRKLSLAASHASHAEFPGQASSHLLAPVPENIAITKQRLLRPFLGVDQWKVGRRYLIAPAVLAACPSDTSSPFILSRKEPLLATQAVMAGGAAVDGCIVMGNCLLSYTHTGNASITAKTWCRASLVLRQNYLLEFDEDVQHKGEPRGYAHLERANARPHPDFPDALELDFYGSPCSKNDLRSLVIRLADRSERDACVSCLNRAAAMTLSDIYQVNDDPSEVLGDGQYSKVRRAVVRGTNEQVALKVFDKTAFWKLVSKGRERADTLVRETSVQATLTSRCQDVPSFLQLRGFFETSDQVVLELELLGGTDLFRYISSRHGALPEEEAAWILADVLKCLLSMNTIGAAHRDIKPANILMCNGNCRGPNDVYARVKVCDFGMSTFVGVDGQVRGRCGTPGYVAPEIFTTGLHGGYGNKVDVYSVGVTLYVMLCGYEPFYGETDEELVEANRQSKVDYPQEEWKNVSKEAQNLVEWLMQKDPSKRPSAREALLHPWFRSHLGNHYGVFLPTRTQSSDVNSCAII